MKPSIHDSEYIFDQNYALNVILLGAAAVFITVSLLLLAVLFFRHGSYSKEGKEKRYVIVVSLTILAIMFSYPTCLRNRTLNSIKKNPGFTVGITTNWRSMFDGDNIEYYFIVDGKRYDSQFNPVFNGEAIPGIEVPDGSYRVIYNKENPAESIIDFKMSADTLNAGKDGMK